ncbi:MAG: histidinol-phosphate transaminase, partial [Spirochaetales bacterium]|nr:histidinol-phosphate transaminase [Spirochaetales bacterium]
LPSMANFIFIRKKGIHGLNIYGFLKNKGLLVRYFGYPGIKDFVRVTIGKKKDMIVFLELLKSVRRK